MSFSEDLIKEALKANVLPLWNAFYFFTTYANIDGWKPKKEGFSDTRNEQLAIHTHTDDGYIYSVRAHIINEK